MTIEPERNAKHTPGPWMLDHPIGLVLDAAGAAIQTAGANCLNDDDGSGYANARLIAAAPDLLQALKETLAYWDSCGFSDCEPDCECIVQSVQAAIAKAEGR